MRAASAVGGLMAGEDLSDELAGAQRDIAALPVALSERLSEMAKRVEGRSNGTNGAKPEAKAK